MKRILILIAIISLVIPFYVYAEDNDNYVLILSKDFLNYADTYELNNEPSIEQKIDYYKKSRLSIRDYLIYKAIYKSMGYTKPTDFKDGVELDVKKLDDYKLNDKEKVKVLKSYSTVTVKIVDNKPAKTTSSLNFTNIEQFLDSNIYCYFLFNELIKDSSSPVQFIKYPDKDKYGSIINSETKKELLNVKLDSNYIVFETPNDVNAQDNVSFLQLDRLSKNVDVDYLSVIFSNTDKNKKLPKVDRFNQELIFVGICSFLCILVISLLVKKGKEE